MTDVDGAAVDPVTGDFVFSAFDSGEIWVIGRLGIPAPYVTLTSPTEGSTFDAPASLTMWADAGQPGGKLDEVDFYVDGSYSGSWSGVPPYSASSGRLDAGTHELFAVALGSGLSTTSAVVHVIVTNVAPAVQIATPADFRSRSECAEMFLSASTTDGSGSVTNVSYYVSPSTLLGSVSHAPYAFNVSLPTGTNEVFAVAADNCGSCATSAVLHAIFGPTPAGWLSANLLASRDLRICYRGTETKAYVLEFTPALASDSVWIPVVTNTLPSSGLISILRSVDASSSPRFFRMRQQ